MRIVFLTGIWPPDVGGPATHGPEFSRYLVEHGNEVTVITMGDGEPAVRPCEVVVISRASPFPVRYGRVAAVAAKRARSADVIYATATYAAASFASSVTRTPLAAKLVSDPAYERARRYGLFSGTLEEFQQPGSVRVESLKRARTQALRRARAIVVPSAYLASIAGGWGLEGTPISVLPNPVPAIDATPADLAPGTFVFVGRLTDQKALEVAIAAIARVPAAHLIVVGDGPDRERLEAVARDSGAAARIDFRGSLPRAEALALVAGSEAALLTSAWENFPHSAVEALAAGVPVVSTAVGGVPEIVSNDVNGLLVPIGDTDGVAVALTRIVQEAGLRERLAAACRQSVAHLSIGRVYAELAAVLEGQPVPDRNPRVLFVGRSRYRLPLPAWLAKKWDALEEVIDYRILGAAEARAGAGGERFWLSPPARPRVLDGALFYISLPFRIGRRIHEFRPEVIVAADPLIGAASLLGRRLARTSTPLIIEVHGDWHTFTRSYGSSSRRLLSSFVDRLSVYALRRADATRALSAFTSGLIEEARGEPATATFPTYSDLSAFLADPVRPIPDQPVAVFVGMLEAYKNIDGLAAAWRRVATSIPEARLVIIGKGRQKDVIDALMRDVPEQVEYHAQLLPAEVAAKLDEATLLVLPSWPEGLGRVIIEAFARGRGVVATAAGGVLDLVTNGVEGILIAPADTDALVTELSRVLSDRDLAERLGAAAHVRYADWHATPAGFAQQMRDLVDLTLARHTS